jgi:hypothetical protein
MGLRYAVTAAAAAQAVVDAGAAVVAGASPLAVRFVAPLPSEEVSESKGEGNFFLSSGDSVCWACTL